MEQELDDKQKEEITSALAENLPVLRSKLGLSQEELAKKIGVTRQTIINIEKNKKMGWTTALALLMLFAFNPISAVLLAPLGILTNGLFKMIGVAGAARAIETLIDVFQGKKSK